MVISEVKDYSLDCFSQCLTIPLEVLGALISSSIFLYFSLLFLLPLPLYLNYDFGTKIENDNITGFEKSIKIFSWYILN